MDNFNWIVFTINDSYLWCFRNGSLVVLGTWEVEMGLVLRLVRGLPRPFQTLCAFSVPVVLWVIPVKIIVS